MQEKKHEDIIEIDLQELLGLLFSNAWKIILSTFIFGVLAFLISSFMITPKYKSTTSIIILNKNSDNNITYSDVQLASQLTKDYEVLIKGRTVLEQVMYEFGITDEDYEGFSKRIAVTNSTDTRIISITVKDRDPIKAKELADRIREISAEHIQSVTDVAAVNVADIANLPTGPAEPNILKWTLVGAAAGMMISMIIILMIYLADDTIQSADDIEKYLGFSTLALIPSSDAQSGKKSKKKKKKTASQVVGKNHVLYHSEPLSEDINNDDVIKIMNIEEIKKSNAEH